MHTVPKHLRGATLGKAHQWVRSMTDTREYALENPSGQRVSLGDLTNGSVSTVRIVGEIKKNPATPNCGCGQNPCITYGTMQNPAHPAAFTGRTFGMNRHVNLTHILPEEVKPALVSSMVREQGLFGAVQSLSILMARPLKEFTPVSPMAEEILRARFYDFDDSGIALRNPAPIGLGRSYGGRLLGQEIAMQDAALKKFVGEAIDNIDKIDVTVAEMNNFVNNCLTPFLLAAEANRRAISYIRQYILPAAKDYKIRGKNLQREFEYMVKHMATDPADFYYGKEFAIVAHPAFLFPQFGPMVLPTPTNKRDKRTIRMINDLFANAGNPPRFEGGTFVRRDTNTKDEEQSVQFLGDYLLGGAKVGDPLDWDYVNKRMKKGDIGSIIRAVALTTDKNSDPLASDEGAFIEAYKTLTTKTRKDIADKVAANRPAPLFIMDLNGMRPRPVDWPDALVLSAMEILGKYRAGVAKSDVLSMDFNTADTGLGKVTIDYAVSGETEKITVDLDDLDGKWIDEAKNKYETVDKGMLNSHQWTDAALEALKQAGARPFALKETVLSKSDASIGEIMTEAVSLCITKHGYEPDEDDIRFTTALVITATKQARNSEGFKKTTGIAAELAKVSKETADADRTKVEEAIKTLTAEEDSPAGALIALMALKKAFGGKD